MFEYSNYVKGHVCASDYKVVEIDALNEVSHKINWQLESNGIYQVCPYFFAKKWIWRKYVRKSRKYEHWTPRCFLFFFSAATSWLKCSASNHINSKHWRLTIMIHESITTEVTNWGLLKFREFPEFSLTQPVRWVCRALCHAILRLGCLRRGPWTICLGEVG